DWDSALVGSPAVRGGPPPPECATGAVSFRLSKLCEAGRSHPAAKPSAPPGCSEASPTVRERSSRPRPAFPYWSVRADTHEPDSEGYIPAPSSGSSRLVAGRTP